jgi:hypothetical protein
MVNVAVEPLYLNFTFKLTLQHLENVSFLKTTGSTIRMLPHFTLASKEQFEKPKEILTQMITKNC